MSKQTEFNSGEEMAEVYEVVAEVQMRQKHGGTLPEALQNTKFLEDMDGRGRYLVLQELARCEKGGNK